MSATGSGASGQASAAPTFRSDLRLALTAWRAAISLPVLTAVLAAVLAVPALLVDHPAAAAGASAVILPVSLFVLGFRGTARIWYVRLWRGERMTLREAWLLSWRLLRRMLVLGLLVLGPYVAVTGLVFAAVYPAGFSPLTTLGIAGGFSSFLLDVALTFVVPAIVFSTDQATTAWRIGFQMLKEHRRHALMYLLTPPLALVVVSRLLSSATPGHGIYVVEQVLIGLLDLAFKGAITAYYLRHAPPPPVPEYPPRGAPGRSPAPEPTDPTDEPPPPAWRQDSTGIPLGNDEQGLGYRGRHR